MKKTIGRKKHRVSKKVASNGESSFRMAIISSRGQITIPQDVREIMHIRRGSVIGFEPTRRGILMVAMKVQPQNYYTEEEWLKIEKLSKTKGRTYKTAEKAKKHIADL